ncbi:MAG: branched-chain amino acid ABC transporter permease [Deltaproteobacteria bacterium]|nr:branched-chain amino acid ABC transporter permease [Deltaproteobacteria bacterium]
MAHGAFYMLGAYGVFTACVTLKLPLPVAVVLSLTAVALIAVLIERVCLRPLKGSEEGTLFMTLILALMLEEIIQLAYGPTPRATPAFVSGRIALLGVNVPAQRMLVVIVFLITIFTLWIFISKTKTGGAILSVAQDPEAASLMGINSKKMIMLVNGMAASLAALAGVLVAPFLSSSPTMWELPLIKAFTVVILGGLGSVPGSILAALILGYSETTVAFVISPRVSELVVLVILFLVIVLRPSGLMGAKTEV